MSHRALNPEQFQDLIERHMQDRYRSLSQAEQVQMVNHAKRQGFKWVGQGATLEHPDGRRIEL